MHIMSKDPIQLYVYINPPNPPSNDPIPSLILYHIIFSQRATTTMRFNLLTTALLCASAVHAHNYTVMLTNSGGHTDTYHGPLPVDVPCAPCQPFKSTSDNTHWVSIETPKNVFIGKTNAWQLRFYKSKLCTDKHHLSPVLTGPFAFCETSLPYCEELKSAHSFSVCRPDEK
ncbi:hypothetical protein BJ138DRAFT_1157773 [Hygrophoropsis aurantiaca]|uniref:Uncharacterized protein n=1 Tax=Hygrophoropsis aurantiaca TaxID=72124 RepID=A0ACB8A5W2_9AGAM|nr:hypothetical protein BJ138DRAFT_1157773 [Hygrophoropsis aurantiaca]